MRIKYKYKNKIFEFNCKDENKIIGSFKVSLKRRLGITLNEFLYDKGFEIEKCKICKIGDIPIDVDIKIDGEFIDIRGFKNKKLTYCYGTNINCKGIQMNPNSFEFISIVNGISMDDAKKFLKQNNKSPFYRENFKSEIDYKKSQSRSLEYYIEKYGEDVGREKFKNHTGKISNSNKLEGYIAKYGEDGKEKFNLISKSKDSMSLFFFMKKNNGDIEKSIFEFENRKESVNVSISSLINKYGKEIGNLKHTNRVAKSRETILKNENIEEIYKRRAITIENMIRKYGEDVGKIKYEEWKRKVIVPICRASKESLNIFIPLIEKIKGMGVDNNDIYIGYGNKNEFFLKDGKNIYFYDFTIRNKKIIIEYNGVLFHPKNENSNWINIFDKNITSQVAYNKQKNKIKLAEENGFKVLELWSDDNNNLNRCLSFINENI